MFFFYVRELWTKCLGMHLPQCMAHKVDHNGLIEFQDKGEDDRSWRKFGNVRQLCVFVVGICSLLEPLIGMAMLFPSI